MITPRPAKPESDDDEHPESTSPDSPSAIADLQFWMDHPSLDDLTAAQSEPDRQQVRRDVEECIRLLNRPTNRIAGSNAGIDSESTLQSTQYSIVRVLGVGAFGVVLQAKDRTLNRDVAIKMLRPSVSLSKEARSRFTIEGEALARCDVPGIVTVYEVGSIDGHPYLVMGLVEGTTLAGFLRNRDEPVTANAAAQLVAEVAQAVHQAHQRGILHRDLKPSNVLLQQIEDSKSNVPYTPFVSDFGLAKDILPDSKHNLSHTTTDSPIIGTVRYMSPEQATGRSQDVSVTSDVFSLGVILYELLTLQCPFQGATTFEIIQQVVTALPKLPRQLNPSVPRDLNAIVGRCLEKVPSQRYSSARELADDLERFLAGRPVMAKPAGPIKATWFWAKRNPGLAIASMIIWIGLLASTIAISLLYRSASEARQREEASRRFALRSMDDSLRYTAETILQNVPQSAEKKLDLHLRSLKKHEEYAKLRGHDEESMHRLSIAHHYVANDASNCQQFDLASFHRNRCLEIVGTLAKKYPKNAVYQFDIFMNRYLTRSIFSRKEYVDWLLVTREHLQKAMSLSPDNPDYEDCDSALSTSIGAAMQEYGKGDPREWFTIAISKARLLTEKYPDKPHYSKQIIRGHLGMVSMEIGAQKWQSACDHCVQALDCIENNFCKSKDQADIHMFTLSTLEYYGEALWHVDKSKALEVYDQYIGESMQIEKLESRFAFYRMRRSGAFLSQAKLFHQLGEIAASQSALTKAKETLDGYEPAIPSDAKELEVIEAGIAQLEKLLSDP